MLKKAGLEHHRVHDLRHTFAVNSLRAGDDIKTLQENMGHFSAAFTLDRYRHVTEEMRKASSQRMQAFIENITPKTNNGTVMKQEKKVGVLEKSRAPRAGNRT